MIVTGERFVPHKMNLDSEIEHYHRYSILKNVVRNKIVLDAACGTGYGSDFLANTAERVYAIDINSEAINYAKDNYTKKNLNFKQGNINKLDFPNDYFDVVVSYETIEHVDGKTQECFLKEIKRVLKDDGILIMSTPNKKKFTDERGVVTEFHIKEFYEQEYIDFISNQFKYQKMYNQYFSKASQLISDDNEYVQPLNFNKDRKGMFFIVVASNSPISNVDLNSTYYYPEEYSRCNDFIQIYYSINNKFNEKDSMVSYICSDDKYIVKNIDMDNIKAQYLRIDPLNTSCEISINNITITLTDGKNISIEDYITNADNSEKLKKTFLSIDPQIIIDLKKIEQIKSITLKYEIHKYKIDIYEELCRIKEENSRIIIEKDEIQLLINNLQEDLNIANIKKYQLEKSLDNVIAQNENIKLHNDEIKQVLYEKQKELDKKILLNNKLNNELNLIYQSKAWKFICEFRKVKQIFTLK